jgi:hypothetical protein
MRILFVISTIALIALLWASISIARHVRSARRKRRALTSPPSTDVATPRPEEPFNNDLGDLSDPYEVRRTKPRDPSRL